MMIKVAYFSSDFRTHSVSYFAYPIIRNHDKSRFDVYCFYNSTVQDNITDLFKKCSKFINVYGKTDDQILQIIRDEKIDIGVDLSGHTGNNMLSIFKRKPFKKAYSYIGFPGTTGFTEIDYFITSEHCDTPEDQSKYAEQLIILKGSHLCYDPINELPQIKQGIRKNNTITFGSMNILPKINDQVLSCWMKILSNVPGSGLLVKCRQLNDVVLRKIFMGKLEKMGFDVSRVELRGMSNSVRENIETYNDIDILLDTFPYNGTTTTCEALMMGVPVINLIGNCHKSRIGNMILRDSATTSNCASVRSVEEYIRAPISMFLHEDKISIKNNTEYGESLIFNTANHIKTARKIENEYAQRL